MTRPNEALSPRGAVVAVGDDGALKGRRLEAALWWALPLLAGLLSALYVLFVLRGGPRIIDAAAYLRQASAIAHGGFSWTANAPFQSEAGRFLLERSHPDGTITLSTIFPPGFPMVLALGVAIGMPMVVGPILGALLVAMTRMVGRRISARVGTMAAVLSVLCASLRYHTADLLSHGWAALCILGVVGVVVAASPSRARAVLLGLGWGALCATRPASAAALAVALAITLDSRWRAWRWVGWVLVGAAPGVALLMAHAHEALGTFGSTQMAYYARSDGPTGCFRYGFGQTIGCLGEHADHVTKALSGGFVGENALFVTLRRLKAHAGDALNAWPLFALVLWGGWLAFQNRQTRLLPTLCLTHVLAYAPFYFDGNIPGGGARLYADLLGVEHVLAAMAVADVAARCRAPVMVAATATFALGAVGFFTWGIEGHRILRDMDGGRPMWDEEKVQGLPNDALIFTNTDHGFLIGSAYHPGRVARLRLDAIDHAVWMALGKPNAYQYDVDPRTGNQSVSPYVPTAVGFVEGESLWPARQQRGAWAFPLSAAGTCALNERVLGIVGSGDVTLALPANEAKALTVTLLSTTNRRIQVAASSREATQEVGPGCTDVTVALGPGETSVLITVDAGAGTLGVDRVRFDK